MNLADNLFIISLTLTFVSGIGLYILVSLNWYKTIFYRATFVKNYCINNEKRVRDFYIKNIVKNITFITFLTATLSFLNIFSIVAFIYLFASKQNSIITYYHLIGFVTFGVMLYLTITNAMMIAKLKEWSISNIKLPKANYIENDINWNLKGIKQISFMEDELRVITTLGKKSINMSIRISKNFEDKTDNEKQKEIYEKLIFDFDNTKWANGEDIDINSFQAIFSKYNIV
ncbi:MAG0920 family protein [Mycoplasmopsis primatum]|uniref:MAG0920 family protein n=1 Tax=Mycoplasmopsis primatum TaxID=55604 RepID=UPI000495874B|nr:hypothetical protein [Mycoplasmopsis primatum]